MKKRPTTAEVFFNDLPECPEQDALEAQFFQRVLLPNGTFKTTAPHRLDDLNDFLLPYLRQLADRPLRIMDVAASSGVSTVEWLQSLRSEGIDCDMTATDVTVCAVLMRLGPGVATLVDRNQQILHMDIFGMGIIGRAKRIRRLPVWALRTGLGVLSTAREIVGSKPQGQQLLLLSKRFAQSDSLRMVEDDLSQNNRPDFIRSFHVVRAANILNAAYFPADVLSALISNLKARLKPEGLLTICRSDESGTNNATLFRMTADSSLSRIARLNKGSEVDDIIEHLR